MSTNPDVLWEHEVAQLTSYRKTLGVTQVTLAEMLQTSAGTIWGWETTVRRPSVVNWMRWRKALGLEQKLQPAPEIHEAWKTQLLKKKRKK